MFAYILFILITSLLTIIGKQSGKKKLYYFFKPMTMLLIILFPLLFGSEINSIYQYMILMGLLFSFIGDIFLMFPQKHFKNGLLSFLVGHIMFIIAFNQEVNNFSYLIILPIMIYMLIIIRILFPHLEKYKIPVIIYMVVISLMFYSAWNRYLFFDGAVLFVLIGSLLFTISDTVLAFNKFYKKFKFAEPVILSTYFTAQLIFASTI